MPRIITLNSATGGSAGGGGVTVDVPAEIIAHNDKNGVENLIRRYVFTSAADPQQTDILIDDNINFTETAGYKVRIRNPGAGSSTDFAWHMPGGGQHYWYNRYQRSGSATTSSSNSTNGLPWNGGSNTLDAYNNGRWGTATAEIYLDAVENKYVSWFHEITPAGQSAAFGAEGGSTGYTQNAWTSINIRPYGTQNWMAPNGYGNMIFEVYKIKRVITPLNDGGIST